MRFGLQWPILDIAFARYPSMGYLLAEANWLWQGLDRGQLYDFQRSDCLPGRNVNTTNQSKSSRGGLSLMTVERPSLLQHASIEHSDRRLNPQ